MKKIYTLALAALCALGASAADGRQTLSSNKIEFGTKMNAQIENSALKFKTLSASPKAVDFASIDEMAGDYEWSYMGLLNNDQGAQSKVITIAIGGNALQKRLSIPLTNKYSVTATVNLTAGTVSIANGQKVGEDEDGDILFYVKAANENGQLIDGKTDAAAAVGTIEGSTITFPATEIWALGDPNAENLGWYKLTYANSFAAYVEDENWVDYCNGTFVDGWILPAITYQDGTSVDPKDYPLSVKIQQNVNNANLYRLVDPYHSENFPMDNNAAAGYIEFSLEDPDFVLVLPGVYSGVTNGSNKINAFNIEGFYTGLGYSKDKIFEGIEGLVPSTFDGENTVSVNNCCFNYPNALDKIITWQNANGESLASKMVGSITFDIKPSAIGSITTDDSNAPVEYFNLQGVKLANPEAGQIVIRRQGSQVSKVYVK